MTDTSKKNKTPLVRITRRKSMSFPKAIGVRLIGIALALVVCAILINAITHMNPLKVYSSMVEGAFGSSRRSWATIRDAMMLLCIAIGLAPAFKMRFWNIGAEGQILVGGIASAACMIYLSDLPNVLLIPLMAVTSLIAGALWGLLPAIFKSKFNTNETLFTLMMNYVAIQLTSFFVAKWENPYGSNSVGIINPSTRAGWFPNVFGQQYGLNAVIVIILMVLMYVYLKYSKQGYEIMVVGESENTARYAGIDVTSVMIRTMLISGAICGFAGFLSVSGMGHTISVTTAGGRGFTAIIVAWLSKFNTGIMMLISFLLTFLSKGAIEIATQYGLNEYASQMITGILLFFILGSEFFIRYKLIFRGRKTEVKDK